MLMLSIWFLILAFFHFFPQIDIAATRIFFQETECPKPAPAGENCGFFPISTDPFFIVLRKILFYVPAAAALVLLGMLIFTVIKNGDESYRGRPAQQYSLSLLTLALGPYVLVNLIFKMFSGRPRPNDTDLFGGTHIFMPAGEFGGECPKNCSFVSGEAAGAGWVICLLPLIPKKLQPFLIPPAIAICIVTPALRVFFGGHYLSDVILGWLSSIVLYAAVFSVANILEQRKFVSENIKNVLVPVAKSD